MKGNILLVLIICARISLNIAEPTKQVSEAILEKVAKSLEMYVDELPQMPKLYGYGLVGDLHNPTNLSVGMYMKKWVSFYI